MPFINKLDYAIDILVLGGVIYFGVNDEIGLSLAGIGIYALGQTFSNISYELKSYK